MGRPMPGWDVAILDEDEQPVAAGRARGGLPARSLQTGTGRSGTGTSRRPARRMVGWSSRFHTKDAAMGRRGQTATIRYAGRADDVIIKRRLPDRPVRGRVGVPRASGGGSPRWPGRWAGPDERRGTVVKAFVVLASGDEPSDELGREIGTYVRERDSAYAYPRRVEFVDDLRKTLTGKIRRIELREREQARNGSLTAARYAVRAMPLVRDVILRDGSVLRLREPAPDDEAAIKDFFDRLDPESRYLRFHGDIRSDRVAAHYAAADGENRVALLAHREGEIVAVGGIRAPARARGGRGRVRGARLRAGPRPRDADARAARGGRLRARHRPLRRVCDDREPAHAAGVLERGLRGQARVQPRGRRAGAGHPPERDARRADRRTRSPGDRRFAAPLLAPSSLAVVGAPTSPPAWARCSPTSWPHGFSGIATPVNRAAPVVQSVRAYTRVSELPEPPELAILAVPAAEVLDVARDAASAGVRALIVVSAGFAERDERGSPAPGRAARPVSRPRRAAHRPQQPRPHQHRSRRRAERGDEPGRAAGRAAGDLARSPAPSASGCSARRWAAGSAWRAS